MAMTSKKNNRKCIVCSKCYSYCNSCSEDNHKPAWYAIFHDQNCHDIYDAVYNILPLQGKGAAKNVLDKCDLSNKENFHPNIIKVINEIYDIKDEKAETVENVEEIKGTEEVKEDVVKSTEKGTVVENTVKEVKEEVNKVDASTTASVVKRDSTKTVKNKK